MPLFQALTAQTRMAQALLSLVSEPIPLINFLIVEISRPLRRCFCPDCTSITGLWEVDDCFSSAEIVHYEDLGFCPKGEGGRFIQQGRSDIGGKVPVNASGGLLSKGHVIGATGISELTELVRQLRGEAGKRRVAGAKVAL
jgi:hypothetical protein